MSDPRAIDSDPRHLFPPFRAALLATLTTARQQTGVDWAIYEGFRSQARQTYLYAQGRSRPGPIVTWMRNPRHHGAGLASDQYSASHGWSVPYGEWQTLQAVARSHGLEDPAFVKGDLGHIQWPARDTETHRRAREWVAAGFPASPDGPAPTPASELVPVVVVVGSVRTALPAADTDATMEEGHVVGRARPVLTQLGAIIEGVDRHALTVHWPRSSLSVPVPSDIRGGHAYIRFADLAPHAVAAYDGETLTLTAA